MRYYMILLRNHKVVEICSYDTEFSRDKHAAYFNDMIVQAEYMRYDEVQTLNEVL